MIARTTARYKVMADSGGWRVRFFCDLSGEQCFSSLVTQAQSEAEAAELAWKDGGSRRFNR